MENPSPALTGAEFNLVSNLNISALKYSCHILLLTALVFVSCTKVLEYSTLSWRENSDSCDLEAGRPFVLHCDTKSDIDSEDLVPVTSSLSVCSIMYPNEWEIWLQDPEFFYSMMYTETLSSSSQMKVMSFGLATNGYFELNPTCGKFCWPSVPEELGVFVFSNGVVSLKQDEFSVCPSVNAITIQPLAMSLTVNPEFYCPVKSEISYLLTKLESMKINPPTGYEVLSLTASIKVGVFGTFDLGTGMNYTNSSVFNEKGACVAEPFAPFINGKGWTTTSNYTWQVTDYSNTVSFKALFRINSQFRSTVYVIPGEYELSVDYSLSIDGSKVDFSKKAKIVLLAGRKVRMIVNLPNPGEDITGGGMGDNGWIDIDMGEGSGEDIEIEW